MAVVSSAIAIGSSVAGFAMGLAPAVAASTLGTFAVAAIGFATQAAIGLALNALTPKPKAGSFASGTSTNRGYTVTQRGSALDHQIIYGRVRSGGVVVFDGTTGQDNKFFHRVIAFTGHEIESFDEIHFNDEKITVDGSGNVTSPSRYSGFVRIKQGLGTQNQVADPDLLSEVSGWTNEHRLRGISYLYVRLKYDNDVFPNGVPGVTATIKGKKVYDPRTDTTAWSDNPALCLRDYIISDYGLNEDEANVDDDLFSTAADVCDETDTLAGTTRYTCNGAFTTNNTPYDSINDILTSMGGLLWYAQGKWRAKPAYWVEPTVTFTEDDLRSNIAVQTKHSRRDNFNTVRGTFRGEESDWQVTDYPEVTNADFLLADNGQESVADIELPFTDNSIEARRIARIALERNRQQLSVQASFGLRGFQVQVGDVVRLTIDRFGWVEKEFEVTSWTFGLADNQDLQVQMALREISESVFDEIDDGIVYERDNTTLLTPFEVPSVGLELETELRIVNEEVFGIINVIVDSQNDLADSFEVQYKKSSNSTFKSLGGGSSTEYEILIPEDDTYDVRARAINALGIKGPWTTFSNFSAEPFAPLPQDVEDFSVNVTNGSAQLSWEPVPDLDLAYYEIRYSPVTSGAVWSESVILVPKVARPGTSVSVPARQGSYLIKAVDKVGGKSENATVSVVFTNLSDLLGLNVIETYEESPDFPGVKDKTVALTDENGNGYLTLDTELLFDEVSGDFDDGSGLFDGGQGNVTARGIYNFENVLDLGTKYSMYISTSISFDHIDYVNAFDFATGLFDSRLGLFDGDTSALDAANAKVQISTTDDDPSGSPTWSDWQDVVTANISARAVRFRAVLTTKDGAVAPRVNALSAEIDMQDRVEAEEDINFTGTTSVTFNAPFSDQSNPAIGLSLTNLSSGDYYQITGKDHTGFTITVYDNTDTQLTTPTQLDYVAKGFGKEITV